MEIEMTREQMIQKIRRADRIRINPYLFMGGVDCLRTILSIRDLCGGVLEAGVSGGPMYIHGVRDLPEANLQLILDLIYEHYPENEEV